MALAVRDEGGKRYPVVTCDTCGQPIEDPKLALVAISKPDGTEIVAVHGVYHNGPCDPYGPRHGGSDRSWWIELDHYLIWLAWNCRLGVRMDRDAKVLMLEVPELDI